MNIINEEKKLFKKLKILKRFNSICLITHREPDTDALASLKLMKNFLKQVFKTETIDLFASCESLPFTSRFILNESDINQQPSLYDCAILFDSPNASKERIEKYQNLFESTPYKIIIDHHSPNQTVHNLKISQIVSSTCEILYKIFKFYNYNFSNHDYENIYAGLITDTNNFSVGATSSKTFEIASTCIKHIDKNIVYEHFFQNNTLKNMQVLSMAIQNIESINNNEIIFSYISKETHKSNNLTDNDYIGIINRIATIENNHLTILLYPKNNKYYVSLRGRNGTNCLTIAKQFGGGGHKRASAFLSAKGINSIKKDILNYIKETNLLK